MKPEKIARQNAERERRYALQSAAEKRIAARLARVLNRVVVAATLSGFSSATAAQLFHARRFAEWGDNEDESLPTIRVDPEDAEKLVQIMASMFGQAYKP